ncbi:helix-turn-helix transcriptional regulator [Mycobacterium paraintracellulare]|uniref:helix-turn-helix transcriptional regulator n=1 Tax=Mycobacterium paraintracellulare TaxID=1138383 RepID=UPI0019161756|nr:helix-turn-helix domain-containing protein [Mycobacterium paraintracellulare]
MTPDLIPASQMKTVVPGTTDQTWAAMRHKGTGPRYVKLGRKVYYRRGDLQAWIEANVFTRPDCPVVEHPVAQIGKGRQ